MAFPNRVRGQIRDQRPAITGNREANRTVLVFDSWAQWQCKDSTPGSSIYKAVSEDSHPRITVHSVGVNTGTRM